VIQKIFSDIALYTLANIFHRVLIPFLSIIFISSFSTELYGAWSIYASIIPLLILIIDLGFSKALGRLYFDFNDNKEKSIFIGNIILFRVVSFLIMSAICFIILYLTWEVIFLDIIDKFPFIYVLTLYVLFEVQLLFILTYFRVIYSSGIYFILRFSQFLITIFLGIVFTSFYGFTGGTSSLAISSGIIIILAYLYLFIFKTKKIETRNFVYDHKHLKDIVNYSYPLLASDIAWWLRNTSIPIILSLYYPLEVAAKYYIAFIFVSAYGLLLWCISIAIEPIYFRYRSQNSTESDEFIKIISRFIVFCISIITIFSAIISSLIITNFFKEFNQITNQIILILIYGSYFQVFSIIWFKPVLFSKETKMVPILTCTVGIISVLFYFLFIPEYVLWGSAIINALAFFAIAIGAYYLASKIDNTGIEFLIYIPTAILVAIAIFSYLMVLNNTLHVAMSLIIIVLCCISIFLILIFKDISRINNLINANFSNTIK
jgi:O-antigen/teichoic acid export membrane protein